MCTTHEAGPPAAPAATAVGDREWAGEAIPLDRVDSVAVTTVCDNAIDIFLPDEGPARRRLGRLGGAPTVTASTLDGGRGVDLPRAEHGFSVHVAVRKGGRTHEMLFDTGVSPGGCRDNLARLGLEVSEIEAIVLSHGHFDHTTGLSGLVGALGRANLPVLLHPEFWSRRRIAVPGDEPLELPSTSRRALTDAGFEVVESRRPSFLFDGSVLVTGEVDRTTPFETGFAVHEAWRGGSWEPDPLILDDQAFIAHVAGKGLVVISGCGHAGIVNICRYARRLTGVDRIYAVIGGFHLSGRLFEPVIVPTCDALAELDPEVIVPTHCTGWKAVHEIAARFPDRFLQSSVGTTFILESPQVA
jgi:7,8-dihydropterin-6-yl-methyl-4-(beta-D-ribofuranosyl)aminobenzene 5'-phosphate synthase